MRYWTIRRDSSLSGAYVEECIKQKFFKVH